ncbi:MAG TPA: hypothetical protein VK582_22280 [Pyrinomonadaceae bacterium]|nr:hypothetical protein [Pyrinomonadaceae bacterium]
MKRFCFGLVLMVVCAPMLLAQKRRPRTKTPSKPSVKSPVKDEASDIESKAWSRYYVKCGESYYLDYGGFGLTEHRDVLIHYQELKVTEADKLNGIERRFISYFDYKLFRTHNQSGWGPWGDSELWASLERIYFTKKNGAWEEGKPLAVPNTNLSCSNIPQ